MAARDRREDTGQYFPGGSIIPKTPTPSGGGGGTSDYEDLANKPQIGGVELVGDKTAADLGLATPDDIPELAAPSETATDAQAAKAKSTYDLLAKKYTKPTGGIPATDMAQAVRSLLALVPTAAKQSSWDGKQDAISGLTAALVSWLTTFKGTDTATTLASVISSISGLQTSKADKTTTYTKAETAAALALKRDLDDFKVEGLSEDYKTVTFEVKSNFQIVEGTYTTEDGLTWRNDFGIGIKRVGTTFSFIDGVGGSTYSDEFDDVPAEGEIHISTTQSPGWFTVNAWHDEIALKSHLKTIEQKSAHLDNSGFGDAEFAADILGKPVAKSAINDLIDARAVTTEKLTSGSETMASVKARIDEINEAGKHVFFDTAAIEIEEPLYLVTIYINEADGVLHLHDQVTGKQYIGVYDGTETIAQVLSKAVDVYVPITVTAVTQVTDPETGHLVPVMGQTVSLYEGSSAETGILKTQATYNGSPVDFMVAKGMEYFITISSTMPGFFSPSTAHGFAQQVTAVTLTYQDAQHIEDYAGLAAAAGSIADIDEAKNALIGKVIEDVWTDYDDVAAGDAASHDMGPNSDESGHPRYYDPMICIDIRDVQDGDGVTHRGAVMMRKWATKYDIVMDLANREEATAAEDATMREGVYYYGYAPDYSNARTYQTNEVCRRVVEGVTTIYKCSTKITAAEEWNPAHWTAITDGTYPSNLSFVRINPNGEHGTPTPFADYVRIFRSSVNDSTCYILVNGHFRYEQSYWRKYLTADPTTEPGAWAVPGRIGQMTPTGYALRSPYQRGCSAELLAAAKPTKVRCASNTVTDGGAEYDVVDKFFLPSRIEYFGTAENGYKTEGATPLKFWRDKVIAGHEQTIDPTTINPADSATLVNDVRKNTSVSAKTGQVRYLRLRSVSRSESFRGYDIHSGGNVNFHAASHSCHGVPACVIYQS